MADDIRVPPGLRLVPAEVTGGQPTREEEFEPDTFDHIKDAEKPLTLEQFTTVLMNDAHDYQEQMRGRNEFQTGKHSYVEWMQSFSRWLSF